MSGVAWKTPKPPKRGMLARRAVACMLFPPPWFSPLDPLFRGAPFFKEFRQGGKPIRGATARPSFRLRSAALRVPAATPPLSPLCAFRPQGRGALVRPEAARHVQFLTRFRPSVDVVTASVL